MEENGVIKIRKKGKEKLCFEDEAGNTILEMLIDIVATHNEYTIMYRGFTDENGEVPQAKIPELNKAGWNFVRQIIVRAAPADDTDGTERVQQLALDLSLADALDFIARLTERAIALQSFFVISTPDQPSSPPRSETVTYST